MFLVLNIIKKFLLKKGFYKKNKFDKSFISGALSILISKKEESLLEIIQIGANDGLTTDYLNESLKLFGNYISILFVEPQINLKKELIANTSSIAKKTSYKFVAVAPNNKKNLKLYLPRANKIPYASLLASFKKEQIINRFKKYTNIKKPVLNKDYYSLNVPTMTLSDLSRSWKKETNLKKICDVLIIDAEGFDDEIIYSINSEDKWPDLISLEWKNLSNYKLNKLKKFLSKKGYYTFEWSKADLAAIRTDKYIKK